MRMFNVLINLVKRIKDCLTETKNYSDTNLQIAKDYTDDQLARTTITYTNNLRLTKIGNIVELRLYRMSYTNLRAFNIPSGYRPSSNISFSTTILYNNNGYQSYTWITTDGNLNCSYYNYSSAPLNPTGAAEIYGSCTYFIG